MYKISKNAYLVTFIIILVFFSYLILKPIANYIILGIILAYLCYPLYKAILKKLRIKNVASTSTIALILLLILVPGYFIFNNLIKQAISFMSNADQYLPNLAGYLSNYNANLSQIIGSFEDFIINNTTSFIGSVSEAAIGFFVLLFVLFYGFEQGKEFLHWLKKTAPFDEDYKKELFTEIKQITDAVIYGQLLVAMIQGILGGILFYAVGIDNPIFLGFLTGLASILPMIGSGLVWGPVGLIEIMTGNYVVGTIILAVGALFIGTIDNFIRPKIIGAKGNIHPLIVFIGVIGGLAAFGFIGFITGPLILALTANLVKKEWTNQLR